MKAFTKEEIKTFAKNFTEKVCLTAYNKLGPDSLHKLIDIEEQQSQQEAFEYQGRLAFQQGKSMQANLYNPFSCYDAFRYHCWCVGYEKEYKQHLRTALMREQKDNNP